MSKVEVIDLRKVEVILGLLILVLVTGTFLGGLFR